MYVYVYYIYICLYALYTVYSLYSIIFSIYSVYLALYYCNFTPSQFTLLQFTLCNLHACKANMYLKINCIRCYALLHFEFKDIYKLRIFNKFNSSRLFYNRISVIQQVRIYYIQVMGLIQVDN